MKDSLLIINLFITIMAMFTLGISYEEDLMLIGGFLPFKLKATKLLI